MIAPNLLELEQLSGERVENVEQAVQVARSLCARGQKSC
ncbi:pyridoxamine kinase [Yersinia pestis]|uniref:Pyridoxamine kinase n=1 Tax=Yersinia pestis TaxID=632 RepID=A0AAX2HYE2_YERPE|nr:pyridoxamine kinase [Yersinia pestis]